MGKFLNLLFSIYFYISLAISGAKFLTFAGGKKYNEESKKSNEG